MLKKENEYAISWIFINPAIATDFINSKLYNIHSNNAVTFFFCIVTKWQTKNSEIYTEKHHEIESMEKGCLIRFLQIAVEIQNDVNCVKVEIQWVH